MFFAWRYRASNTKATYKPDWDHSTRLELVIWGAPLLIIIALGLITWISTHLLDPYRPLSRLDAAPPDRRPTPSRWIVEVVALDWKWLFIYPEQGIATVNELVAPVDVPVRFKITASTVMNSFYIPALAGQIYAMPAHADHPQRGDQQGRRLRRLLGQLQRRRFLGHALQVPRQGCGRLRRLGQVGQGRPAARSTAPPTCSWKSRANAKPVRRYAGVDADAVQRRS